MSGDLNWVRDDLWWSGVRGVWLAGDCPCCGMAITAHIDGTQPEAIGEGVTICGRCAANDHMSYGTREAILAALVRPSSGS